MTYKGLPSSYNKDLQEDKEPLFDAVNTVAGSLQILAGVLRTMTVRIERNATTILVRCFRIDTEYFLRSFQIKCTKVLARIC